MPKQIHKIEGFHGGVNSSSDPRDIADNELAACIDLKVDELGKIRTLGGITPHLTASGGGTPEPQDSTTRGGFGLFYFPHDRLGASVRGVDLTGTHTGGDSGVLLTDSAGTWPIDALIGATANNTTDGSSGTIEDNNLTTFQVDDLLGGSDNIWDDSGNDAYTITDFPETGDDYLVFWDTDGDANARIYSRVANTWTPTYIITDMGATGDIEPTHYVVDGSLRIMISRGMKF